MKERSRKGQLHAPIGARIRHTSGYTLIKVGATYPGALGTGWMLEHRYIMARQLGRSLESYERVHHKNGNRSDNRPENLELWTVQKKDPAGQRVTDRAIALLEGMTEEERMMVLHRFKL